MEALIDGAVMLGLPRGVATEMAAQTMLGSARMVLAGGAEGHPAVLKGQVTTPGGCTIAGVMQMEEGRIRSVLAKTLQAACDAAGAMAKK